MSWINEDYREKFDLPGEIGILGYVINKCGGVVDSVDLREILEEYGEPNEILADLLERNIIKPLRTEKRETQSYIGNSVVLNMKDFNVTYIVGLAGLALHTYHMIDPKRVTIQ